MNKLLKKIITFAFLIIINMQIFGQGSWDPNPWDVYWFTDMVHSLQWLDEHPWFDPPGGGTGSGNGDLPSGPDITYVNIMTYNLWRESALFWKHKDVINGSDADVVALQEVLTSSNFNNLKQNTGMAGNFLYKHSGVFALHYGISILWKTSKVGTPKIFQCEGHTDGYPSSYIVAEFVSFCFVCVHYSHDNQQAREANSQSILINGHINSCKNKGKPVYIAGDFNCGPPSAPINKLKNSPGNFIVLNDVTYFNGKYNHATKKNGTMIDLILEHNNNPNKSNPPLWRGTPSSFPSSWLGKCWCCERWWCLCPNHVSDHKPYLVKLKIK
ncbi:MAG: endonuclease/exonuclease/phosphatase family protein [Marinilabiliaceae bacterium]|nr:endonuclease/exonuclease/phosphatase family protein [Marinilabiliaceae bacterium]